MTTPASLDQGKKVLDLFQKATTEEIQNFLSNGDLVKAMIVADLSKVDRSAFATLLAPAPKSINWTPVNEYAEKIAARSKLRGWGLTKAQIDSFAATLKDHAGPLLPTGISLWLGRNLQYNWDEAMAWLNDEVSARNEKFKPYFDASRLSFYPGSEQSGKRKLTAVGLDIDVLWDRTNGFSPKGTRPHRATWPGLEVAWLLALNPQVYLGIDYETIPAFWAPGLVVGSDSVPYFSHGTDEAFIGDYWDVYQWCVSSVVSFREY
jgi:hypothetical protein